MEPKQSESVEMDKFSKGRPGGSRAGGGGKSSKSKFDERSNVWQSFMTESLPNVTNQNQIRWKNITLINFDYAIFIMHPFLNMARVKNTNIV